MPGLLPASNLQAASLDNFRPTPHCWALPWGKPLHAKPPGSRSASGRELGQKKEERQQILRRRLLESIFSSDAGALVQRWPNWMHMVGSFRWQDRYTLVLSWHVIQSMWGQIRMEVPSSLEQGSHLHSHFNLGRRFHEFVNLQEALLLDLKKEGVREVWIYAHDVRQKSLAKALEKRLRFSPSERPGSWLRIERFPVPEGFAR
ncbi:MAG: hypothetical protein WCH11_07740 [Bdellovibrio sp.]